MFSELQDICECIIVFTAKFCCLVKNFIEVSSFAIDNVSIGLRDGLVLNRWQAITWTSNKQDPWSHFASLGYNGLNIKIDIKQCI